MSAARVERRVERARPATRAPVSRGQRALIAIGPLLGRLLYSTWRVRAVNEDGWRALRREQRAFVFSLWHGQMLPLLIRHRHQGVLVVVSEHRDGEVIARILQRLGFGTIRGSSSRGAARALLAMSEALQGGKEIAVTPDGPRGPARHFESGTIVAAQRARVPVVATVVTASSAWRLRSWDTFMIPKPFARVTIMYSDPTYVDAPDARAAALLGPQFELLMNSTEAAAQALAATDP